MVEFELPLELFSLERRPPGCRAAFINSVKASWRSPALRSSLEYCQRIRRRTFTLLVSLWGQSLARAKPKATAKPFTAEVATDAEEPKPITWNRDGCRSFMARTM